MSRFDKDHYSLIELSDRWRIPFKDIEYYAERDQLEVHTWLGDIPANRYTIKKTADGEDVHVPSGITSLSGYFIVEGYELRKIFRAAGIPEVRRFSSLNRRENFTLLPFHESLKIPFAALEVSRVERERFENKGSFQLYSRQENKTDIPSVSVGRPSVMKLVIQHFEERATLGRLEPTVKAEADYLQTWVRNKMGVSRAPAAKTIANNIRPLFGPHRASASHA